MYSNPAFTGQPTGQPGGPQFPQGPPQQSLGAYPQQTGYGGAQMRPQATGMPSYGQQPSFQAPGQPLQHQQAFQTGAVPSSSGSFSSQPTGQPMGQFQQPAPTGRPAVGQTSSEIAQSFQKLDGSASATTPTAPSSGVKIPSDRLSFLTLDDQLKFGNLFRSAVGDGQALEGASAQCASVGIRN